MQPWVVELALASWLVWPKAVVAASTFLCRFVGAWSRQAGLPSGPWRSVMFARSAKLIDSDLVVRPHR